MKPLLPCVPARLAPLASEILAALRAQAEAEQIVLGGGVALQHYCEYRDTRDLDAWWLDRPAPATETLLERVLTSIGQHHGYTLKVRKWGETQSYELVEAGRTVFSFQIAVRSHRLDATLPSNWAPVRIESLLDNLGSKMNAVVGRGAPRDLLDVFEVVRRQLVTVDELWVLWCRKNSQGNAAEAKLTVLRHLEMLEARRPLGGIEDPASRGEAQELRTWLRHDFCTGAAT